MKHFLSLFSFLLISSVALTGCEVVGDIFKAGVWTGAILIVAAIGVVIWIISKSMT